MLSARSGIIPEFGIIPNSLPRKANIMAEDSEYLLELEEKRLELDERRLQIEQRRASLGMTSTSLESRLALPENSEHPRTNELAPETSAAVPPPKVLSRDEIKKANTR